MGYQPTDQTDTLKLRLGTVKTNAIMTASSAAVQANGLGFAAATDAGQPAMVFGAGPAGAPLITTVASVMNANNAVLADAASTDVTDVTIIVFRRVSAVSGSIRYSNTLTSRDTGSFSAQSGQGRNPSNLDIQAGQPFLLTDDVLGDLLGGAIDQVKTSNNPGSTVVTFDCVLISYDKLASKRTTGELTDGGGNPASGTFTNMHAGDIIAYLVTHALGGDGMGSVTVAGPVIAEIRFSYAQCDAAFDAIAAAASDDTHTYYWYTDPWRVVRFAEKATTAAPWNISDADASDGNVLIEVSITRTLEKFVNRAFVRLGKYISDAATESFPGDGSSRQFAVTMPFASVPTVTVDGIGKTVGVNGVDTGKDWYFNLDSNILTQDAGGTVLTGGNTLAITYQGYISAIVNASNSAAVDERSGVEGGTGYHETVLESNTPSTAQQGTSLAAAITLAYGIVPDKVEIRSYRGGLKAGQEITIRLTELNVNSTFLIDSVSLSTEGNRKLWTASGVDGALIGDWKTAFANLGGGTSGGISSSGLGGGGATAPADTVTQYSASGTLPTGPEIAEVDTAGGTVTLAIPDPATMKGQRKTVYKSTTQSPENHVILNGFTIDGASSYTLTQRWQSVTIEAVDTGGVTAWKVVAAAVTSTATGPAAPGDFTIGTATYEWMETPDGGRIVQVSLPVTPPSPIGTTKGGHIYAEIPDQSAGTTARMDGTTTMDGSMDMSGLWRLQDLGEFPYVASEQPWVFQIGLGLSLFRTTIARFYVEPYSDEVDDAPVRQGEPGATPNTTLTVLPFGPRKPASGSNITPIQVTSLSATAGTAVNVGGKLRRPISVTVDLSGLPAEAPDNWAYQLIGYINGDLSGYPFVASGQFNVNAPTSPVPAGPDGIDTAHTFGPEELTSITSITIYAVSGLFARQSTPHGAIQQLGTPGTFMPNNIVPGITPSCTVSIGTTAGVLNLPDAITAALNSSMAVLNNLFGVAPAGIDNSFLALLAVATGNIQDAAVATAKAADLFATTAKLAAAAVTTAKVAAANITTALIANAAITTALIGNAQITTALIGNLQITTALIANAAVGTALIQNAAIINALIGNLAVGTAQIQNLAVTNALIANLAVTDAKINDLNVAKLTAGTITVSSSSPVITVKNSGNLQQVQIGYAGVICFDSAGTTVALLAAGSVLVGNGAGSSVDLNASIPGVEVNGTQVLGTRKTGWAAASGVATRSTFATSSVTLPQLAEHVKALIDDFMAHGALGA